VELFTLDRNNFVIKLKELDVQNKGGHTRRQTVYKLAYPGRCSDIFLRLITVNLFAFNSSIFVK